MAGCQRPTVGAGPGRPASTQDITMKRPGRPPASRPLFPPSSIAGISHALTTWCGPARRGRPSRPFSQGPPSPVPSSLGGWGLILRLSSVYLTTYLLSNFGRTIAHTKSLASVSLPQLRKATSPQSSPSDHHFPTPALRPTTADHTVHRRTTTLLPRH